MALDLLLRIRFKASLFRTFHLSCIDLDYVHKMPASVHKKPLKFVDMAGESSLKPQTFQIGQRKIIQKAVKVTVLR